ncbi:MAG: PH domain-containing protein [Myxococcota bacterium]|jgi:uncharacterized membrane protein YdbT with pleckstrin-like domain|nr:PH domain-containing protein [Myxococcota bacterium]
MQAPRNQANEPERVIFEGRPALFPTVGALLLTILTVGLAAFFYWARKLRRHYRITTERVLIETGILSKKMEQIDLYRINDYTVERPISQRLMGTGNLHLDTMDKSMQQVDIFGIPADVNLLYEEIRKATEIQKQRRGTRVVDYE